MSICKFDEEKNEDYIKEFNRIKSARVRDITYDNYSKFLKCYVHLRNEFAKSMYDSDRLSMLYDVEIQRKQALIAVDLHKAWKWCHDWWNSSNDNPTNTNRITFGQRISIELYLQLSLLTCLLLAKCRSFNVLLSVSTDALAVYNSWRTLWNDVYKDKKTEDQTYNVLILRYYYVSLESWCALAKLRLDDNLHSNTTNSDIINQNMLKELYRFRAIDRNIGFAEHPLHIYVCSEYYRKLSMPNEASNSLIELISAIDLYDYQRFSPFNLTIGVSKDNLSLQSHKTYQECSSHEKLRYYERITGQQQF
jgi:hypothetical protein